ncbi:acetyl-CoA carboxylase biotin carboxyl carrier protein [Gemmatimonadota bacterium]
MIDLAFVESLIRALDASSLDSLEFERGGTRISLSKSPPCNSTMVSTSAINGLPGPAILNNGVPMATATPSVEPAAIAQAETSSTEDVEATEADRGLAEVTSPMVGTFYRAPAPESDPYVEVGARVGNGTVLCIIEAMKLMNELECEVEGTIARILVEDSQPVEYGQVLFLIDPS